MNMEVSAFDKLNGEMNIDQMLQKDHYREIILLTYTFHKHDEKIRFGDYEKVLVKKDYSPLERIGVNPIELYEIMPVEIDIDVISKVIQIPLMYYRPKPEGISSASNLANFLKKLNKHNIIKKHERFLFYYFPKGNIKYAEEIAFNIFRTSLTKNKFDRFMSDVVKLALKYEPIINEVL